jgi:hypothetical protein
VRGGPPALLIGAAICAMLVFVAVVAGAFLTSGARPGPNPADQATAAALNTEATRVARDSAALQASMTAAAGPAATAPAPAATATSPAATAPPTAQAAATAGPTQAAVFVVPTAPPTPVPGVVAMDAVVSKGAPDYGAELNEYWRRFYAARTLTAGGHFDLATVTDLTAPPYRDYTIALLEQSQADADAGKLQQVSYSGVTVRGFDPPAPAEGGALTTNVTIDRTMRQQRSDITQAPQTLTLQFRLRRVDLGGGKVSWQAYDFFNPATNAWLSDTVAATQVTLADAQSGATDFFKRFYAARSLAPGHPFDLAATGEMTAGAYQDYTLPLLQQQQAEADAGRLSAVSYSDISAKVESWDPLASSHGGLATVSVTRTSHTQQAGKPADTQTATYQFRLHRHQGEDGRPLWIAVDFLSPITNRWVSESAGMSGPIPPAGHG